MSTKQVNNTKAPKADSSKPNEQQAQQGNAMATAEKTNTPAPEAAQAAPTLTKAQKDETRFQELLAKDSTALGLSDEEETEYLKLRAARKQAIAGKRKSLDELVAKIVDSGFTFKEIYHEVVSKNDGLRAEVTSLFSAEEIKKAAGNKGKGSTGKTGNRQQTVIPEESLVIHVKASQGQGFKASKEKLLEGKWGTFASKLLKDLNAKDEADFVAKLKEKTALRNDFEELYKSDDKFKDAVKKLFTHTKTKDLQPPPKKKPA